MPYTCNNCKSHVETRYHCTVCDDFDLCVNCKDKDGHPHPMEKLDFALDNGSSLTGVQRYSQILKHAYACRDAKCDLSEPMPLSCQKMKRVIKRLLIHAQRCRIRKKVDCPECKLLIELMSIKITSCIRLPRQVRDEAATIAATMIMTTTSAISQSTGQTVDKQFVLSKPEHQQLMQIDAGTPDQPNPEVFQILKRNLSFMAACNSVEH